MVLKIIRSEKNCVSLKGLRRKHIKQTLEEKSINTLELELLQTKKKPK